MNINPEGENLFFLISQPRSGSTLLQMILAGNPELSTTSEPWIALHPIFAFHDDAIDPKYGANQAKEALFEFLKGSGVNIEFYKKQISTFLLSLYNQAIEFQGKKYFLDKTPRYYNIIDDLYDLFPNAKFIILFRNPLAILNSVLKTWVKDDYSLLVNNFNDLMVAPYKLVKFLRQRPKNCFKVHYEELVSDPENVIEKLCDFLGIEYAKDMIDYGRRNNPGWKYGDQVGIIKSTRPNVDSAHKWKNGLEDSRDRMLAFSYLDSLGEQLIRDMGYDYRDLKSSLGPCPSDSKMDTLSWSTVIDIINCISSVSDVRRAFFGFLLDEGDFSKNIDTARVGWSDSIEKMAAIIIRSKVEKFLNRIDELENRNDALSIEANKLSKRIETITSTLSWRMTSPLRNSKILKIILKRNLFK